MDYSSQKRNFLLASALLLLAVAYFVVWRIHPYQPDNPAQLVPETAIFYFEQRNLLSFLDDFSKSPLGKTLRAIDFAGIAKEIGTGEEAITAINNLTITVNAVQDDTLFQELFGKNLAVALLPPLGNTAPAERISDFLHDNVVVIAKPKYPAKVVELLSPAIFGVSTHSTFTSVQYGRHRIKRIIRNGTSLVFARLDDFFIISLNERQLRRCIDTHDGEQPSFANNRELLVLKNHFPSADRLLIISNENSKQNLPPFLTISPFLSKDMPLMETILGLGYGAKSLKTSVKERFILIYDPEKIDRVTQKQLSTRPQKPTHFSLTTEKPMLYLWSNSFSINTLFTKFVTGESPVSSTAKLPAFFGAVHEEDIVELPDFFGDDITVVAETGARNTPLRLPSFMVFLPVLGQKDVLRVTMEKLLNKHSIPISTGVYGTADYTYWSDSPQDGLTPLYGFWQDFFYLGNSITLLHKIIDTNGRGYSVLDVDHLSVLDPGLAEENNAIAYSNNVELIDLLKDLFSVLGNVWALENREMAKKAQIINNKILIPLLDAAKMYDTSVLRSNFVPEMIIVDINFNKPNYP
jgi:hypothetical protein